MRENSHPLLARGFTYTHGPTEIIPGIHVTAEIPRRHKIEDTGGPFYQDSDCTHKDALPDDQALFIETPKGLIVLLGCCHSGVINTLEYGQMNCEPSQAQGLLYSTLPYTVANGTVLKLGQRIDLMVFFTIGGEFSMAQSALIFTFLNDTMRFIKMPITASGLCR